MKSLIMEFCVVAGLWLTAPVVLAQPSQTEEMRPVQTSLPFIQAGNAAEVDGITTFVLAVLAIILVGALGFAWKRIGGGSAGSKPGRFKWRQLLHQPHKAAGVRVTYVGQLNVRTTLHTVEWDGKSLLVVSNEQFASVLLQAESRAAEQVPGNDASTKVGA